jgi:hypothetical protein
MIKKLLFSTLLTVAFFPVLAQKPLLGPINGPGTVCWPEQSFTRFTAFATNSPMYYTWWTVPSSGAYIQSNGSATVYIAFGSVNATYTVYCTATNGVGKSAPSMKVVHSFEQPNVTFSGGNFIHCKGGSPTMLMASTTMNSGSSTFSYQWSPASGLSNPFTNPTFASPPVTTTYTLVVSSGPCSDKVLATVKVEVCTGLKYFNEDGPEINVYPNPSASAFTVKSARAQTISVVNQLGQRIRVLDLDPSKETRIELSPAGVYYIISDQTTYKVIVTH